MSFNPANFPWTMSPVAAAASLDDVNAELRMLGRAKAAPVAPKAPAADVAGVMAIAADLNEAAARFAARRDDFAAGKAETCYDIATKLAQFGSFASDKQRDFALKLIEWSKPRVVAEGASAAARKDAAQAAAPAVLLPKLFALMQRLAKLEIGSLKIARKNGDSLCWVKHAQIDQVIGRIENGVLTVFGSRLKFDRLAADSVQSALTVAEVEQALLAIEADPEAAAVLHGKASGRCAVCSRDLTDPKSIERGIGPVCAERMHG